MLRTAALLTIVALAVAACGGGSGEAASSAEPATGEAVGVLVKVDQYGMTLAPQDGGAQQTYSIRPVDRPRLDLFHLAEHARQRLPVRLSWREEDGIRYAERVDDA